MRPSIVPDLKRSAIRKAVGRFRTAHPRVFGSVVHGTDQEDSDLVLLVDAQPGAQSSSVPGLSTVPPFPRRWPSVRGHVWQDGALGGLSRRGAGGIARHGAAWLAGCVRTDAGG